MTDTNIYVAVDMGDMHDKGTNDRAKQLSKYNDPATEAGLFGSGVGAQMDWVTAKPLSTESINAIRHVVNSYLSGFAYFHFVQRAFRKSDDVL